MMLWELQEAYNAIGYRVTPVDDQGKPGGYIIVSKDVKPENFDIRDYERYTLEDLENILGYYKQYNAGKN